MRRFLALIFSVALHSCSKGGATSSSSAKAMTSDSGAAAISSDGSSASQKNIADFSAMVEAEKKRQDGKIEESSSTVLMCIARNAKTRVVYQPAAGVGDAVKVTVLTDCIERSIRAKADACACEIAACSPAELDVPRNLAELIAQIIQDKAYDLHCSAP